MTQQELMAHPFFGKFQQRVGAVINGMVQRGMMNPNESQMLVNMLKASYPQIHQFVEGLTMRYGEIRDDQMDSEIYNWLQNPLQQVRARIAQMSGGFGTGFGPTPWGGGYQRPAVGFGYDSQRGGGGFGSGPGIPQRPFSGGGGGGPDVFRPDQPSVTSLFGGQPKQPTEREQHAAEEMKKRMEKPVAPPEWKTPEIVDEKSCSLGGDVSVLMTKFTLSSGDIARRVIVHDPKVGYTSDQDALEHYKGVFALYPDTRRKFLTVAYRQLKAIHVGHDEFMRLAQTLAANVGKASDVEGKLRAILAATGNLSVTAYEEFKKLFLDELDAHIQCGELCDSFHPKNILNRPDRIEDVLAWVTGDIDKNMLAAMKGMDGFEKRLDTLLTVVIDTVVTSLPKLIINTNSDMTMLDDFYRALPGIWTTDCGSTFQNSEDLINLFLATRETIEGSKTENATKAESALKTTLMNLSKQFTLIFIPRVVSWCNYSKADVCRYDETGNCQPASWAPLQPRNDVEFFVGDDLDKWSKSRDTKIKWCPKSIYMEVDEETFCLQYGRTTNDGNWCCSSKYWH